jgi:hypothetical protein
MRTLRVFDVDRDAGNPDDISGADVVVVRADAGDDWIERIRVRAPNAVVVVVGGSPEAVCEGTMFPRARIIGVDEGTLERVLEAIVEDDETEFESVVRCEGERGIEGEFARVPVRIAGRGVVEIIDG